MFAHKRAVFLAKGRNFLLHHNECLVHFLLQTAQSHNNLLDLPHKLRTVSTHVLGLLLLATTEVFTLHLLVNHNLELLLDLGANRVRVFFHSIGNVLPH